MAILAYRERERVGPARIAIALGVPRSTVHRVLCRFGRQHLLTKAREPVQRIVHHHPGAQVGIDFKELLALVAAVHCSRYRLSTPSVASVSRRSLIERLVATR